MLLLVRYSSGGRAATRPLLAQRPCCYSSDTRPAAVLLLVRYSFGQTGGGEGAQTEGCGSGVSSQRCRRVVCPAEVTKVTDAGRGRARERINAGPLLVLGTLKYRAVIVVDVGGAIVVVAE